MKSMDKPRFSIIIPTYNNDAQLMQCLHSLSHQKIDPALFEVIVINDGGNEELNEIIGSEQAEISMRYFRQDNKGPAAARNLGIRNAKGNIILFLDDDSLPLEDWLHATIDAWDKYPDYDGIGGYTAGSRDDNILYRVNKDIFNWYLNKQSDKNNCTFLSTHNAGYKKTSLVRAGIFDERFKKASGEDRDLSSKIVKNGGRLRLDKSISVYHDREISLRSFVRKYYNYGKAAFLISSRYSKSERSSLNDYFSLLDSILQKQKSVTDKMTAVFILLLSQFSTFIGYQSALVFSLGKKKNK
jgi:glycosyltransferase involved in cell wall biosynthesis